MRGTILCLACRVLAPCRIDIASRRVLTPSSFWSPLDQNTKRETGRAAQLGNILAAKAVADIIRTTLGPRSMLKMLLDAAGGEARRRAPQGGKESAEPAAAFDRVDFLPFSHLPTDSTSDRLDSHRHCADQRR